MRLLSLVFSIFLMGCASSPHQGDLSKHVNVAKKETISETDLKFNIGTSYIVDMRGMHSNDDSVEGASVLYQGGAGLIGLLVQVGTHAAILQSQRSGKLSAQQEEANKKVLSLIDITNDISVLDLMGNYRSQATSLEQTDSNAINIEPVFYSNGEMNRLSLNLTAWSMLKEEKDGQDDAFKYKNLLKIHSPKLTESQSVALARGDRLLISDLLSSLLQTALYITKNDVTGKYSELKKPVKTHHIESDSGRKVVRGSSLETKCGYQIIRDIRSWVIAYPSPEDEEYKQLDDKNQCLASL